VVVDLGLPDMDGTDLVRHIRTRSEVPVVVLSARHDQRDKVAALDAGADDYLTKPFGLEELLARMRAALRRAPATAGGAGRVQTAAFTVDLDAQQVTDASGAPVRLTPTEWHLLEVLARRSGELISQRELLLEVWGPAFAGETHYLRVYVAQLRSKLEPDPSRPRHIVTEPGRGYRLVP
jgi:two-component system KDP operon response regulator KdpE